MDNTVGILYLGLAALAPLRRALDSECMGRTLALRVSAPFPSKGREEIDRTGTAAGMSLVAMYKNSVYETKLTLIWLFGSVLDCFK